ncbi:uncharacterized protein LOC119839345 isoform X2 [Zerene cesonia]|nr:uncharacterized protein LOC119839345 isoform X2 [Zerene cesonia]
MWWGAKLAFKPAALALTAVTSLLPARQTVDNDGLPKSNIDATQRFVVESAVKEQATHLLNNFPPGAERVGTVDDLMRSSGYTNRETFEILLGYLVAQGAAVKLDDVVKLAEPNRKADPISEMDQAMVKLVSAERRLDTDAARLARELETTDNDVRAALKLGNKLAAKNHLRRKHKTQLRLQRCEAALENVRQLLQQARDSAVDSAVVDTYRTSAQAMKSTMKGAGLEEDLVHDTMDDLKEVMDTYNEVERALGGTIDDIDVADLEQELNELLSGAGGGGTPQKQTGQEDVKLPSPPARTPRKESEREREFVFDGEERMLADLDRLGAEEPGRGVAEALKASPKKSPKAETASKPWYPPQGECLAWERTPDSRDRGYGELRQDERLHPGQELNVDFTTPPRHYGGEFQVRDHRAAAGVWLFNSADRAAAAPPGPPETAKAERFVVAPGGERETKRHDANELDELERRLHNLRGFRS